MATIEETLYFIGEIGKSRVNRIGGHVVVIVLHAVPAFKPFVRVEHSAAAVIDRTGLVKRLIIVLYFI